MFFGADKAQGQRAGEPSRHLFGPQETGEFDALSRLFLQRAGQLAVAGKDEAARSGTGKFAIACVSREQDRQVLLLHEAPDEQEVACLPAHRFARALRADAVEAHAVVSRQDRLVAEAEEAQVFALSEAAHDGCTIGGQQPCLGLFARQAARKVVELAFGHHDHALARSGQPPRKGDDVAFRIGHADADHLGIAHCLHRRAVARKVADLVIGLAGKQRDVAGMFDALGRLPRIGRAGGGIFDRQHLGPPGQPARGRLDPVDVIGGELRKQDRDLRQLARVG